MLNRLFLTCALLGMGLNSFAQSAFFNATDEFLQKYVTTEGRVDYEGIQKDESFDALIQQIAQIDPNTWSEAEQKAFYINAYNLLVIRGALEEYPVPSVQEITNFFDKSIHTVSGKLMSLNELEKGILFPTFPDARLHFVLVCGALGCPPIIPNAYFPDRLEEQIEEQTRLALNNPIFIRVDEEMNLASLSEIFRWYGKDFGRNESEIISYINDYRTQKIPASYKVRYYTYDWAINSVSSEAATNPNGANSARYVVSAAIPKNTTETKIFNNLYTQRTRDEQGQYNERATFFTTITSFVYGLTPRLNVGFDMRYRAVRYGDPGNFPLGALADPTRQGITTLGPKVRFAPVPKWSNFSIQSAFWVPLGNNLTGREGGARFIDWDGPTWWTQFFNDIPIGQQFSVFTEIDFMWEDIGSADKGRINRISTPATVIGSFFPNKKTTLYALGSFSPFWQQNFDYFWQVGAGSKYQFTPDLELELSYTYFSNAFLATNMGQAGTYNLGLRFNI
ncbi:MAG: DUF547 domain-containing protein [Bacteroidota bacterium]